MTCPELPAATIIAAFSHSSCNACGKSCDPRERKHTTRLGSSSERKGCGIEFTHISTRSSHPRMKSGAKALRPDLEFVEFPRDSSDSRGSP